MTPADYRQRVASNPGWRHTADRWREHLKAFPELDERSRRNCEELIASYTDGESQCQPSTTSHRNGHA